MKLWESIKDQIDFEVVVSERGFQRTILIEDQPSELIRSPFLSQSCGNLVLFDIMYNLVLLFNPLCLLQRRILSFCSASSFPFGHLFPFYSLTETSISLSFYVSETHYDRMLHFTSQKIVDS